MYCIVCADIEAAVREQLRKMKTHFDKKEFDKLSQELYTADCVLLPPDSPCLEGQQAVRDHFAAMHTESGINRIDLRMREIDKIGDHTAWERGNYTLLSKDNTVLDRGKWLAIWKKQHNGDWKMHRDMFSSNGDTETETTTVPSA